MIERIYIAMAMMVGMALPASAQRIEMSIAGEWKTPLGSCKLPGTTDENRLGDGKHATNVTTQLTRLYPYEGRLDYERTISITKEMAGKKNLALMLERTKPSTLWIDGDSIGQVGHLHAPHVYPLPQLTEGEHTIRLRIDNRQEAVPQGVRGSHAWTDATQTNWNGVIGKMIIAGADGTYISRMNVYPDVKERKAEVKLLIVSDKKMTANITFGYDNLPPFTTKVKLKEGMNDIDQTFDLGQDVALWSEYHPNLHTLNVKLDGKKCQDERKVRFGVREFGTEGTQLTVNGKKTFLRGTHDGCVFPINAYSPTDVDEWRRLFRKAKEYGINHFRFHSYTPTEACFEAADEEGIYLQTELPLWGTIDKTTEAQNEYLMWEAFTTIEFLGNHPSFMAFGLGNELWGDFDLMRSWLDKFRKWDNRHLYVYGSNNTLGWQGWHEGEDYMVTCRVGGGEHYKTNTRTSFSFADEEDGGLLNHVRPNTRMDFSYPVSQTPMPIVSHETCQFQMYPDYDQIKKYTGILYPYNLEIFRDRLKENGLTDQQKDFTRATNRWALECYKADIEWCVRTRGFGGYQLLDLKDYPGQGSALCGILDVFMDAKDKEFDRKVVNVMQPVVPLLKMDKMCWSTSEDFVADIAVANYTEDKTCRWLNVTFAIEGKEYSINLKNIDAAPGDITTVAEQCKDWKAANEHLRKLDHPQKVVVRLETGDGNSNEKVYRNEYNLWFYPDEGIMQAKNIVVADTLDQSVMKALKRGKTVVLSPTFPSIEKQSIGGLFTPDYWNYAMFKTISENNKKPVSPGSLGMLMDSEHPVFDRFVTDGHSDWQWWCIAKNSRPLILNSLAKDYRPIVQTVDNIERNHKLGILMEFKVGRGRLLITTTDLESISQYVEGRAYRNAIMQYVGSDRFNPSTEITEAELRTLLYSSTKVRDIQGVKNLTDYKEK